MSSVLILFFIVSAFVSGILLEKMPSGGLTNGLKGVVLFSAVGMCLTNLLAGSMMLSALGLANALGFVLSGIGTIDYVLLRIKR